MALRFSHRAARLRPAPVWGRVDNLNGIHSIKRGNDFAPVRPVAPKIRTRRLLWSVSQSHAGILLSD
jgi:hypothetical protein